MSGKKQWVVMLISFLFTIASQAQKVDSAQYEQLDSLYWASWDQLGYDANEALKSARLYVQRANEVNDSLEISYAYDQLGLAHYYLNHLDSAIYYHSFSFQLFKEQKDSFGMSEALTNLGLAYSYKGDLNSSFANFNRAFSIDTSLGDPSGAMFYYYNIAGLFLLQENYVEANRLVKKALEASNYDTVHTYLLPSIFLYQADILTHQKLYDSAMAALDSALPKMRAIGDSLGVASVYSQRALILKERGKFRKALRLAFKATTMDSSFGDPYSVAYDYEVLATIYLAAGQVDSALHFINKAKILADEQQLHELTKDVYKTYSEVLEAGGDYKESLKALKISLSYKDSIGKVSTMERVMASEAEYKDKRLKSINKVKEVQFREIQQKNKLIILLVLLFLAGIALLLMQLWMRKKTKRYNAMLIRRNSEIIEKQKALDEKTSELEKNNLRLEKLNRGKDRLFSVLSHDLRQPFNQINATIDAMDNGILQGEEKENILKGLRQSVSRTSDLVNNLLIWSKAQFANISINRTEVNLNVLLKKQVLQVSNSIERKKLRIDIEIDPEVNVYVDADHMAIIFRNLLQNAIKFTRENNVIEVKGGLFTDGTAYASITDYGVGMDEKTLERIISGKNGASERGTYNETGTGLGLVIVREFLAENGGSLEVESTYGHGSTFKTILPLAL